MIRPARHAFIALILWMGISIPVIWGVLSIQLWSMTGFVIAVIGLLDLILLITTPSPAVQRQVSSSLPVGVWSTVKLAFMNHSNRVLKGEAFDHIPPPLDFVDQSQPFSLPSQEGLVMRYRVRPLKRGDQTFGKTELLMTSPLQFFRQRRYVGEEEIVKVYPNFAELTKFAILATDNQVSQMGIRKRQRRGEGMEFHQLREYRQGDSLRQLDWKATSRCKKLISREYQDERDQQILFLVDCGQRMRSKDGNMSHFDYALDAMLLLSYVALKQGDAVGFFAFGGEDRWQSPRKGTTAVNALLNSVYDLQPTTKAADFTQAAMGLLGRQRKRSLVVLLTNVGGEELGDLLPALKLLKRQHLVLVANLREKALDENLTRKVSTFDEAISYSATHLYLDNRQKRFKQIQQQGVLMIDVNPEDLPVSVVNRYLDIKRSGRL